MFAHSFNETSTSHRTHWRLVHDASETNVYLVKSLGDLNMFKLCCSAYYPFVLSIAYLPYKAFPISPSDCLASPILNYWPLQEKSLALSIQSLFKDNLD